jgi:hypothetical protein
VTVRWRWPFFRRAPVGRHALGAAVRAIPAGPPPTPAVPMPRAPVPDVPPAVTPEQAGPRVELGFSDGTVRMLDPSSPTARALGDLVAELTGPPPRAATGPRPRHALPTSGSATL